MTRRFFTFEVDEGGAALTPDDEPLFQRNRIIIIVIAALAVLTGLGILGKVVLGNTNRSTQAADDAAKAAAGLGYLRQEIAFRDQGLCLVLRYHLADERVKVAYAQFECALLLSIPDIQRPTPPPGITAISPTTGPKPGDLGLPTPPAPPINSPRPTPVLTPTPVQTSHPPPRSSPAPTVRPSPSRTSAPTPTASPSPLLCITTKLLGTICTPL